MRNPLPREAWQESGKPTAWTAIRNAEAEQRRTELAHWQQLADEYTAKTDAYYERLTPKRKTA